MMMLSVEPLNIGAAHMADTMLLIFMTLVGALVLIAGIDAPYQMWQARNQAQDDASGNSR